MRHPFIGHLIALLFLCVSYFQQPIEEEFAPIASSSSSTLHITTRAAEGSTLTYPLHVYAFSTNGQLVTQQVISSASDPLSLSPMSPMSPSPEQQPQVSLA